MEAMCDRSDAVHSINPASHRMEVQKSKTYSSRDSPVVTHLTTNPPVCRLSSVDRTGNAALYNLWPYVKVVQSSVAINHG
jgi:hypothetical protein